MPGLLVNNITSIATLLHSICIAGTSKVKNSPQNPSINLLPNEVLREIFLYVLTPTSPQPNPSHIKPGVKELGIMERTPVISKDNPITPFPLSQVCRRWRGVAHATRALWRSIAIVNPGRRHVHRVALWMRFARYHPLDVALLQIDPPREEEEEDAAREVLAILCENLPRWRHVDLRIGYHLAAFLSPQLNRLRRLAVATANDSEGAPILCRAEILLEGVVEQYSMDEIWWALNALPTLRFLRWRASHDYTPPSRVNAHLRVLMLSTRVPAERLVRALRGCTSLEVLVADIGPAEADDEADNEVEEEEQSPLLLPHLHSLLVRTTASLAPLFEHCTLPALLKLEIDQLSPTPAELAAVCGMLDRSSCRLQICSLCAPGMSSDALTAWLALPALATVETLAVSGADVTDTVLEMLTRGRREAFFDSLRHLSLSDCNASVDPDVLLRMIGSRYWTAPEPNSDLNFNLDWNKREELRSSCFTVRDKTYRLRMYEQMINECANRMSSGGWEGRSLTIRQI